MPRFEVPKETFNQLPAEKRERVLAAAAGLFAQLGFARCDMAQIASLAGVAKGSLYNYFDSKEDLYLYVCLDGLKRSRAAVYDGLDPDWGIFRQLAHIFRSGVEFVLAHPDYSRLYLNLASSGLEDFADKLSLEIEKHTADFLKDLIRRGVDQGLVRSDIDVNLAAFLINSLYIIFAVSLVSRHFQIRMREYLEIEGELNGRAIEEHLERTMALIRQVVEPLGGGGG